MEFRILGPLEVVVVRGANEEEVLRKAAEHAKDHLGGLTGRPDGRACRGNLARAR